MSVKPPPPDRDRDRAILTGLREVVRERDPVPEAVLAAMRQALTARIDPDAAAPVDGVRNRFIRTAKGKPR